MAENRATFSLRRLRSLGFSKWRRARAVFNVPSRSTFFFNRRSARSTGSLFFSLISVKIVHFLSYRGLSRPSWQAFLFGQAQKDIDQNEVVNSGESRVELRLNL